MEKFQITEPPKVWVSGFPCVNRNGISPLAIMKKMKNGCLFVNINHTETFQITDPPPQSLGLQFSMCQQKQNITGKLEMQIFFFSEFSIGSFFPITHPRLHFNIYAWLHLKNLCVDIYAWFTSHLWSTLSMDTSSHFFCKVTLFTDNVTLCTLYHLIR